MVNKILNRNDINIEEASNNIYNDCKKAEIRENGFKVAFGISIIIVGIFSIFYDTGNTVLVGISLSSVIFSMIDAIPNRNNLWYILPLSVLLLFSIFPNLPFIKLFLDTRFNNLIVFISFGTTFIINYYTSFTERIKRAYDKLQEDKKNSQLSESQLSNCAIILNSIVKIKEICIKDNIINSKLNAAIDELFKYAQEEKILSSIRNDLIFLGIKNNFTNFNISDIEKILIDRSGFTRGKIDEKMKQFYDEHPDIKNKKSTKNKK